MYYSHNLKDLYLLTKLDIDEFSKHDNTLLTLDDIQLDTILAIMLANADIAPWPLTKENVTALLCGEKTWTDKHGTELNLKSEITIEELIESGIICFYNDHCKLNISSIPNEDQIENDKLLQTASKLYFLFNDHNVKPHLTINKSKAEQLLYDKGINKNLVNLEEIDLYDDNYVIELKIGRGYRQLHDNIVAELFSDAENDENSITFDIDKWILIAQFFPSLFLTQINISKLSHEQRHQLAQDALAKIEHDEQLNVSPQTLTANWLRLNTHSTKLINHAENEKHTDNSSLFYRFTISDFITYLDSSNQDQSPMPLDFLLKANYSGWSDLGFNTLSRYFFLPLHIINIDLYADSNSFRTLGYTDKLFSLSDSKPELKYILFCELIHKNPTYIYYLLQRKDTACLAIYHYKNLLLTTFDSHRPENDSTITIHIFGKICDEFIRHYFMGNQLTQRDSQQLALLLETLSKSAIRDNWTGMPFIEKTVLDTLLDKIAIQHLTSIEEFITKPDPLEVRTSALGKLYLLFRILEKHQTFYSETNKSCIQKVEDGIYNIVEYGLSGDAIKIHKQLRTCNLLDNLPWWRLSERYIHQHKQLIGSWTKFSKKNSGEDIGEYSYIQVRRCHLQIMLNMITKERNSKVINLVHQECLKAINSIADDFENGLKFLFSGYINGDYSLWPLFISTLDKATEDNFSQIISILKDNPNSEFIFSLLHNSNRKNRQEIVKSLIEKHYIGNLEILSKSGLNEISEALNFACIHNYMEYAEALISQAKTLLTQKRPGYSTQQAFDLWQSIEYKVGILTICNNDLLSQENKIEQMNKLDNYNICSAYRTDCDHFRRNSFATLYIDKEPERASNIYNDLYHQTKSLFYAGNRFSAKLNLLTQTNADAIAYQTVLNEWLQASQDTSLTVIEDVFIQIWMTCLYRLKSYHEVKNLWDKLLPHQKYTIEISKVYIRTQQRLGHLSHAIETLNELERYHQIALEDSELITLRNDIQNGIMDGMDSTINIAVAQTICHKPKSTDELAIAYNQIFARPLSDIAMIVNAKNPTVEAFLIENIKAVVSELLCMKIHLNKKDSDGNFKLINENTINSWFTSLFKHRGVYAGITCHEQEPSGISPGGINPGEIDFFFYAQLHTHRVAIGEAFSLASFDRTSIHRHIDKITKYDQLSLDTVIFFAWCNVNNFIELTEKYHMESHQWVYKDFQPAESVSSIEQSDTLVILKEIRLRHKKPVTIYHLLVNLRP